MYRLLGVALVMSACGFPKLPALGDGAAGGDAPGDSSIGSGSSALLAAIDQPFGRIGDTITIEGDFPDGLVVEFPGGVTANATLLGPNRATVVVPDGATTGRLSIGNGPASSLPFRATSFYLFLGLFDDNYHQTEYARAMPQYQITNAVTVVSDDFVYVLGGATTVGTTTSATDKIARARINADSTLDDFADTGQHLITHRAFAASARVSDVTYLIGGSDDQGRYLDTIESASLQPDGTFTFATVSNRLTTPRFDPTCAVIGHWLYVLGGRDTPTHALRSIERAQINQDGSLGPFALIGGNLSTPRYGAAGAANRTTLYVGGGADDTGPLNNLEFMPIMPDGSLGASTVDPNPFSSAHLDAYAIINDRNLFIVGGLATASGTATSNADVAIIRQDDTVQSWNGGPTMISPRGGFAAARVGNFLYAIGGTNGGTILSSIESANEIGSQFQSFDPTAAASLATARRDHASVVVGHWLYVFGGVDQNGNLLQSVERAPVQLDGSIGTFTRLPGMLSEPCAYASAVVMGGNLNLIGGKTPTAPQGTTHVEQAAIAADGSLSAFTFGANALNKGRYGASATVINGHVVMFGGVTANTGAAATDGVTTTQGSTGLNAFQPLASQLEQPAVGSIPYVGDHVFTQVLGTSTLLDSATATVSGSFTMSTFSHTATSSARVNASGIVIGDTLYILGGSDPNGSDLSTVMYAGATNGIFAPLVDVATQTLAQPLSGQTTTVLGNHVYTVGGTSGGVVQSAVFSALLR